MHSTPKHIVWTLLGALTLLGAAPSSTRADDEFNRFIVERCRERAENPDAEPSCKAACISLVHVCYDEQTGELVNPKECWPKIQRAAKVCNDFPH